MKGNSFPCIVSFYTAETLYQLEVQNLIKSCKRWKLKYQIEAVPSQGSWELNCAYKPFFILEKLLQLQEPVLWVDADAAFVSKPQYLEAFSADIAVRREKGLPDGHRSKVLSGTVYANWTQGAQEVLVAWKNQALQRLCDPMRTEEFWDQEALQGALIGCQGHIAVADLPVSYVHIFDHPIDSQCKQKPVIAHYQASRRLKRHVTEKEFL